MTTDFSGVLRLLQERIGKGEGIVREPAPTQNAVAISRYVEGLTDEMQLRGELDSFGYSGVTLERLVLAAQLRRQLELYKDRRDLWLAQWKAGQLTESAVRTLLEDVGLAADSIDIIVAREKAQRPRTVVQSIDATLSILDLPELVVERPQPQPLNLGLSIVAADEISRPAGLRTLDLALDLVQADVLAAAGDVQAIDVTITIDSLDQA